MSALDDLSQPIAAYPEAIRKARLRAGLTNDQLAELSGVPYSTICKVQTGQQNITLPQAAAICAALSVSLDDILPLPQKRTSGPEMHEMELRCSHQAGDIRALEAVGVLQAERIRTLKAFVYVLLGLCALLTVSLGVYMVIDSRIPYAGLIQATGLSGGAWLFLLLIIAAAVVMGGLLLRMSFKYTRESASGGGQQEKTK